MNAKMWSKLITTTTTTTKKAPRTHQQCPLFSAQTCNTGRMRAMLDKRWGIVVKYTGSRKKKAQHK